MTPPATLDDLLGLYERAGDAHYGEDVTQNANALQCARLAQRAGATDELVAAALVHDVGHLLAAADATTDDHHEATAGLVDPHVLEQACRV